MPRASVRILMVVLALASGVAAAQQGSPDPRRPGAGNYPHNQFNLPAYSPPLTPYPPSAPATQQPTPRAQVPAVPGGVVMFPAGWFCPPLNSYYPAVLNCPTQWVYNAPHPMYR